MIRVGDCLETLRTLADCSVDAVVTDPPYGLGKEPKARDVLRAWLDGEEFKPGGAGFMGRAWDAFVPSPLVWAECLRVLKPGGHLVAFAASRTYDWIVMGVRLAGFEVRDQLIWMYGSGFPKSHNLKGDWEGYGTALKPAHEPIVMARKPLAGTVAANVLEHGTGAINVNGCRIGTSDGLNGGSYSEGGNPTPLPGDQRTGAGAGMFAEGGGRLPGQFVQPSGRWPANILHDGSPEVLAVFPDDGDESAARFFYSAKASRAERELGLADFAPVSGQSVTGRAPGSAGAKCGGCAGTTESKRRNVHPTVKPVNVMRWLVRLVGGKRGSVILDPYTGSGTTGVAATLEGFEFIGCELSPEYAEIARARIAHARKFPAMWEPDYQAPEDTPRDQLDLFGELYAEPKDQRIAAGVSGSQKPSDAHRRQAGAAPDSNHESPASE